MAARPAVQDARPEVRGAQSRSAEQAIEARVRRAMPAGQWASGHEPGTHATSSGLPHRELTRPDSRTSDTIDIANVVRILIHGRVRQP